MKFQTPSCCASTMQCMRPPLAWADSVSVPYFLDHPGQDPFGGRNPEALAGDMLPIRDPVHHNNSLLTGLGLICLKAWRHFARQIRFEKAANRGKIAS